MTQVQRMKKRRKTKTTKSTKLFQKKVLKNKQFAEKPNQNLKKQPGGYYTVSILEIMNDNWEGTKKEF